MAPAYSVSEGNPPRWDYIKPGLGRSGRSLSENNFAKERRDWLAILLREILQNALDARVAGTAPVKVLLKYRTLDESAKAWISELVDEEHLSRFKASLPHDKQDQPCVEKVLIVEDFGTSGLTGKVDDPDLDGRGQNWNAFWFREGEGGKENTAGNGGAGQGKITYFSTSGVRTIFSYTVRSDDKCEALFGASSFLRDYTYNSQRWKRDAYWGLWSGQQDEQGVLPSQDRDLVDVFRQHLGLERKSDQCGLSLVIPSPRDFDVTAAVQITIAEFFVPIYRGDLVVHIDESILDKESIMSVADRVLSDDRARELHTCMTSGYRVFLAEALRRTAAGEVIQAKPVANLSQLTESAFDVDALRKMKDAIEQELPVAVRFPVVVKSKTGEISQCHFDVHLVCPFQLDRPEQAVIRHELLIGEEPVGGGKLKQRARGLTLMGKDALSKLLLAAEEPTHLRWNTRLPRLGEYYRSGPEVVALIRNAMARLLDILTGGEQKRDYKLLSKYFSAPGLQSPEKTRGKKPTGKADLQPPDSIPPPKPKLLAIDALEDGCRVRPAKVGILASAQLPLLVTMEFAYEGLDKDAFNEYHPLDFDLEDKRVFIIQSKNCTVGRQTLNQLEFTVDTEDFEMQINGFDRNLRLRMRLTYEEVPDAAVVDTE